MRIKGLHIDGFGVWRELTVEGIPDGMTVFFGRNEAGKSTLMQFIRTGFFGFSKERREKYLPPVYGGVPGGRLYLERLEGSVEIQRHADLQRPLNEHGDVIITTPEGTASGQNRLSAMMNEVDETIFSHVFAIGLNEIQELGALNDTQAAEHLYRLTSGFDRVSLIDVLRNIRTAREDLVRADDPKALTRLTKLLGQRKELQHEIDQLVAGGRRWSKIAAHANDFSLQLGKLDEQLHVHEREARRMELAMQIAERWQNRKVIVQQIASYGSLPEPTLIDIPKLDKLNQNIEKQKSTISEFTIEKKHLKESVDRLPINRLLWRNRTRIEALGEHLPWLDTIERELETLESERQTAEREFKESSEELVNRLKMKSRDIEKLTQSSMGSLRGIARGIKEERERLHRAAEDVREGEIEVKHLADSLESARAHAGVQKGAPSTLEDTSRLATRLRKRSELEEKIESLEKTRRDLQQDMDEVVEDQSLPVHRLFFVGAMAIVGVIMMWFGFNNFFSRETEDVFRGIGLIMMLGGFILPLFGLALKSNFDRQARDELNDFLHQLDLVRHQLKRARQTRDEIDAELPPGVSHWQTRLHEAQSQIGKMQDIIPLENKHIASQQHLETLKLKQGKIEAALKKGQRQWREALKNLGLPEQLKPSDMKDVARQIEFIAECRDAVGEKSTRLEEKQNEHRLLCARINTLADETELTLTDSHPRRRLDEMRRLLNDQRDLIKRREELASQFKRLRSSYSRERNQLEKYQAIKRRLLTAAGAATEDEYRNYSVQHQQLAKLHEKQEMLDEQIRAVLGGHFTWDEVVELVEQHGAAGLERIWERLEQDIDATKKAKADLQVERGKLLQEMTMLSENERLEIARLELASIDSQIRDLKENWQRLAATNLMLESVREQHEAQRQPETLLEASKYLEKLTEGHYTRIWTRLVGEHLLVDDEDGKAISVELLSRGTREAVYLALRLALVTAYARRGVVLPMVLDDVLVNLDAERAFGAAKVLAEFAASGYQVLMFTCHEHIHKAFSANGVSVQVLPHHRDVVKAEGEGTIIRVDAEDEWDYLIEEPKKENPSEPEATVPATPETKPDFDMWWESDPDR